MCGFAVMAHIHVPRLPTRTGLPLSIGYNQEGITTPQTLQLHLTQLHPHNLQLLCVGGTVDRYC